MHARCVENFAIETRNLTRRFGTVLALDHVSLSIRPGEFFSLLGPSGCGKTTLLRVIAGLDLPDSGEVQIGGADATSTPAFQRPVNTVFQSYALFPHLDVWDNVAFGLKMKKVAEPEMTRRVEEAISLVRIDGLEERKPQQLSGGQKQRVALARAIVNEPQVLLLDEPLAALDLKLRKELQLELRALQQRLGITFIYVTHDQEEALVLSDRIAVMRQGRIEQLGTGQELYERPRTRFVAEFLGGCNLIPARVKARFGTGAIVDTDVGELQLAAASERSDTPSLAIRPHRLQMAEQRPPGENVVPVTVGQAVYVGSSSQYELRSGTLMLRAELVNRNGAGSEFKRGQSVWLRLPPEFLIPLDD